MTFISYAQNFEDVMLWRALKHVSNGFYIDIGAAWPDEHSVTKAFYTRGWRGINVEPNRPLFEQLQVARPRDINLNLAVGNEEGYITFFLIKNTGLSTTIKETADQHIQAGHESELNQVELTTLAKIYEKFADDVTDVHFLKIDVEGMEKAVLEGNNWQRYRPWIIIVEATLPGTNIECHSDWESILLQSNYNFVYADGVNRFYLAQEHIGLSFVFQCPPNIFDRFILSKQQELMEKLQHTEGLLFEKNNNIQALLCSRSWRITAPCRWIKQTIIITFYKKLRQKAKSFLQYLASSILKRPKLKRLAIIIINYFPLVKHRLQTILLTGPRIAHRVNPIPFDINGPQLSPRAKKIYHELQRLIADK
jgi:FkbM family methyltransferase